MKCEVCGKENAVLVQWRYRLCADHSNKVRWKTADFIEGERAKMPCYPPNAAPNSYFFGWVTYESTVEHGQVTSVKVNGKTFVPEQPKWERSEEEYRLDYGDSYTRLSVEAANALFAFMDKERQGRNHAICGNK